jgi:hypothetical protein
MKKFFIYCISLICINIASAQNSEYSVSLNSGLFSFYGSGTESVSNLNFNSEGTHGYTNNLYGSNFALSVGLSASAKRITKYRIILGLDLGYEILRSKTELDHVWNGESSIPVNGQTYLTLNVVNIFPQLGYRIPFKSFSVDLIAGIDWAYNLSAYEKADATAKDGGQKFKTDYERTTEENDLKQRYQIMVNYQKYGVYVGYSDGFYNYMSGMVCMGNSEVHSRMIRFGISYRLN